MAEKESKEIPIVDDKMKETEKSTESDKDETGETKVETNTTTNATSTDIISDKMREISTKEAYFTSLNEWVKRANIAQSAMAMFPFYLLNNYPQMFQQQLQQQQTAGLFGAGNASIGGIGNLLPSPNFPLLSGITQMPNIATTTGANNADPAASAAGAAAVAAAPLNGANVNQNQNANGNANNLPPPIALNLHGYGFRILDDQAQAEMITRYGGFECIIAPFWKRAIAEIIDVFILLLLKIVVTFTVMNVFDMDLGFDIDRDYFRKAITDDDYTDFLTISMDFLAFSSDLLLLEILTKFIVCFYEAIWTTMYNGATPGKAIMGLRIKYVEAVLPLQAQPPPPQMGFPAQRRSLRALLLPAETPTFKRAFFRALTKNMIMTLLFPMCFIMIFFKNNRTAYDIITKTVVIESNAVNPVIRRHQ